MEAPASMTSGFPGSRVEPYLAGITTTTLAKRNSFVSPMGRNKSSLHTVYECSVESRSAMLPHARHSVRPIKLFNSEHPAIALVFGNPSGRIAVSPNRAAVPVGRDDGGAVKRDLPGFRVLSFLLQVSLFVCLLALQSALPAAAQSSAEETKPKDTAPQGEVKQVNIGDVRKDTVSTSFKPGKTIKFDRSEERRVGKECRSRWSPYH